jgi:drug/metabolite transporter (DMT)-like permease
MIGAVPRTRRWLAIASLVGAVGAWSASLSVVRIAVAEVAPGAVTFWRCVVGALVLGAYVAMRAAREHRDGRRPAPVHRSRRWLVWAAACGVACGAAFLLIAVGMRTVGSGPAGIVLSTIPAATIVFAASPLGARTVRIGPRQLASLGVGLLAAISLALPAGGAWSLAGLGVLGLAAAAHAIANVTSGRSLEDRDPASVAAVAMAAAAVVSLPFGLGQTTMPSATAVLAIVTLGIVPSGLAYVLYFHGTGALGVERAAFSNFLVPPVAVVSGIVALGEVPDAMMLVALALASVALWIGLGGGDAVVRDIEPAGVHYARRVRTIRSSTETASANRMPSSTPIETTAHMTSAAPAK